MKTLRQTFLVLIVILLFSSCSSDDDNNNVVTPDSINQTEWGTKKVIEVITFISQLMTQ